MQPAWLSAYVLKTWDFLHGRVVFLGTRTVITPPAVSNPNDKGATSNNNIESALSFPSVDLDKIAA